MDEAASRGLAREKVAEWACLAIVHDVLPVSLPNNALLDTRLEGAMTWRGLLAGAARAAARGSDPTTYGWMRTVMLSRATFGKYLDQARSELALVRSATPSQRRASRRQAALEALHALYPTAKPLDSVKTITAKVNEWLAKRKEHGVSEDTVSRALKVF
jgi:hypothetical protein